MRYNIFFSCNKQIMKVGRGKGNYGSIRMCNHPKSALIEILVALITVSNKVSAQIDNVSKGGRITRVEVLGGKMLKEKKKAKQQSIPKTPVSRARYIGPPIKRAVVCTNSQSAM